MVFSKVHPACHNIAKGIQPGSNSYLTDKHAACMLACKVFYVSCINCSNNNVAEGIRLLDKKIIFCLYRKNVMQVRAFERFIPLILRYQFILKILRESMEFDKTLHMH